MGTPQGPQAVVTALSQLPAIITSAHQMQSRMQQLVSQPIGRPLTTGRVPMQSIGRTWLQLCVQQRDASLDDILLSEVTSKVLAVIFWLLAGIQPNCNIHNLRAETYDQIVDMCK